MRELADRVGLTYGTMRQYRHAGQAPDPDVVLDGKPFWYLSTADRWKEERDAKATSTNTD